MLRKQGRVKGSAQLTDNNNNNKQSSLVFVVTMTSPDQPLRLAESCGCQDMIGMEKSLAGVKRDISVMDNREEDASPTKKIKASVGCDNGHNIATNMQYSSEGRDIALAALQTSLINANEELGRWKHVFINQSILPPGIAPDPTVVVQAIQKLQASELHLQEQLLNARKREGVLLFKLANTEQEILTLKSTVRSLKRLSKRSLPSMARPLLPKPSNFDEISRWKKEIELAEKLTTELPDVTVSVQMRDMDAECSAGCQASGGKDEDALRLISTPPSNLKKKIGRPRKYTVVKEEDDGEEGKKNWMDSEVETLISLRWEMEPEFLKNAYKQGVDMWAQLQARMASAIPGFSRSGLACQRKFSSLIKQHKKDILEVKEGKHHTWDRHARKFFDSLDRWWHTNGTIMKFATTSASMCRIDSDAAAHLRGSKEESVVKVKEDEEGEEAKKNWLDSEVETMISLRWEMEPEFVENAYKPGEDMWLKLQIRMMSVLPGFTRSSLACQRKFNALIKQHKNDVLDLKENGREHFAYKFYDLLDRWWHTNGTVMKHVTTTTTTTSLHESESLGNHSDYLDDATDTRFLGGDEEEEDDGEEEGKKNWADSEVETLIALRREMEPEFVKNWKKQGGNMWSKLRSRMSLLYPGFSRSPIACKRKFNTLVRQYKKDMHAMDALGEERHSCKHHGLLDQWLHTSNKSSSLRNNNNHNNINNNNNHNDDKNNNNHNNNHNDNNHINDNVNNDHDNGNNNMASKTNPGISYLHHGEGSLVSYEEERELENGDSIFGSLSMQVSNEISVVNEMAKSSSNFVLDKMDVHMEPLIGNLKLTVSK